MISNKHRRTAAWALFIAGAIACVWGVLIWREPLIFERGLRTIAVGLLLWTAAMGAAEDFPWFFQTAARLADKADKSWGVDLSTPDRRFAVLGLLTFAIVADMLTMQYLFIVKYQIVATAVTVAATAVGWYSHLGLYRGLTGLLRRWYPDNEWRRAAAVWAVYALAWAAALAWVIDRWVALATDPALKQFAMSALAALIITWLALGRRQGPEGRKRRLALIATVVAVVAFGAWNYVSESGRASQPRLRVLLLTLDTTRADYLSCYGYPRETSPNLDALAASGARFARAFSNAGITDPSHASILTGTYPRTHGLIEQLNGVTGQVPSLAEYFYERGFATAAVGSRDHVTPSELGVPGFAEMSGVRRWMGQAMAPEAYRRAANYLWRHRDQDLFLWVHFFDPHESYRPHPGVSDHFYGRDRGSRSSKLHLRDRKPYSAKEVKYRRDLYAGEIFYMDQYIGRLIALMREMEPVPVEPLLVAVTADHGEFMGEYQEHPERLGFGHGPVYNLGVHVPMIFSWPGKIPAGTVIDEVVQGVDLAPTVAAYALGVDYPGQGQNLKTVIEGRPGRNFALITHCRNHTVPADRWDAMYAIISGDWKYMVTYKRDGELFDLSSDMAEAFDLSAALPDRSRQMLAAWESWMKATPESPPERRMLDKSEKRALRALGYIE